MKVVSALKKHCEFCNFVKKGKKVYVKCIKNPRHKQRQGSGFCTIKSIPDQEMNNFANSLESKKEFNDMILKMKIQNLMNIK